jgi:hypothetical protein
MIALTKQWLYNGLDMIWMFPQGFLWWNLTPWWDECGNFIWLRCLEGGGFVRWLGLGKVIRLEPPWFNYWWLYKERETDQRTHTYAPFFLACGALYYSGLCQ